MHDTILHPIDASRSLKHYRSLKLELAALISSSAESTEAIDPQRVMQDALEGKMNFPDAYILQRLLRLYRPMEILEVGSFVGFSARWILEVCSGWQGKLTSVDPNIRHRRIDTPGRILKDFNQRFAPDRLETIEGFFGAPRTFYEDYETHEPRQSRAFVDQLLASRVRIDRHWERRFDFIFIDGDHSFDAVKENFQIALGLLRDGGCIAFHDALSWEGVNTALDEIRRENADSAEVRIFGKLDHWVFQGLLRKHTDGIGFFRKLGPSKLVA